MKYSEEETDHIIQLYNKLGNNGLDHIANTLGKSVNSIRSKLVREHIYIVPEKTKIYKSGLSKKEVLRELNNIGISTNITDGLVNSSKFALQGLLNFIKKED